MYDRNSNKNTYWAFCVDGFTTTAFLKVYEGKEAKKKSLQAIYFYCVYDYWYINCRVWRY
jgi:hypothetical protein